MKGLIAILLTAAVTILIFLVLISLHEFGHFIAAKLSGVGVFEFSIGMGPAILKKQKGETLYSLRALPIGGYCKLEGEDEDNGSEKAFVNQKLWKRFIVISAGAVLNVLLGFVIFLILVSMNGVRNTTEVDTIETRANIAQSGISAGDKIVGINGHKIRFYNDIAYYLEDINSEKEIAVTVKRDGKKMEFSFMPSFEKQELIYDENGVSVTTVINGEAKQSYIAYSDEEKELYSEYVGKTRQSERYILGFTPCREKINPVNALSEAWAYTGFVIRLVYNALGELFTGKTGIDEFSGPVGVAAAVDTAVHTKGYGVQSVLNLAAMLTINLGVFNLLPIPALDGGRLLFLLAELVTRRRVPPEKEGMVHAIGMLLLLLFAAVILFNDILKLF